MITETSLTILGSGTSAGVPAIGCECRVCTSSDRRDNRTRPSSCLSFTDRAGQERLVLIDASPDLRQQALRERLRRCDAIVFTHDHVDHTFGLDEVRRFNLMMRSSIDIFAESRTLAALRRVYSHIFDDGRNPTAFVARLNARTIDPQAPIDLHGVRFTPLRLFHGPNPILGFRIDALDDDGTPAAEQPGPLPLAYCTDVSEIAAETWSQLEGLRTLILGMLRYTEHPNHFSVDQATEAARQIGARATWFVHMNHDIHHAELDERLPEGMSLAYDGLVL